MHCERKLKLRSHDTSYCLIEVVTKAGLSVNKKKPPDKYIIKPCLLGWEITIKRRKYSGNIYKNIRYDNVTLSPLLLPARVTNRSHSTYGSSARSDSHRAVFCPNSVVSGWKN